MKRKIFMVLLFIIAVACTACAFAACSGTHTLNYLADKGGYIQGETTQYVRDGEDGAAVTAVADYGYEFVGWSDGVAEASRTDSGVKKDIEVTAQFVYRDDDGINYYASEGGSISGNAAQRGKAGQTGSTVIAVADEGYLFEEWSDGVTTPERADVFVDGATISYTAVFKKQNTSDFEGGIGTATHPYLIGTAAQLKNVMDYPSAYFELTADITLPAEQDFIPIGSVEAPFCGGFDGGGHTVEGLKVEGGEYAGLFGCARNAYIHNLVLKDVEVSGSTYVGGVAGYCTGQISDCTVSGKISIAPRGATVDVCVGGVVGSMGAYSSADVTQLSRLSSHADINVNIDASVDSDEYMFNYSCFAGGVFGKISKNFSLGGCTAFGDIVTDAAVAKSDRRVVSGGLIGAVGSFRSADYKSAEITQSYAAGSVCGRSAGGFIGAMARYGQVFIADCHATGAVHAECGGGFIGSVSDTVDRLNIERCYATGRVDSNGSAAGFAYSINASAADLLGCFATGNVNFINENDERNLYRNTVTAGFISALGNNSRLTECAYTGDVGVTNDSSCWVGGLVGESEGDCTFERCFAECDVFVVVAIREGMDRVCPRMSVMAGGLFGRLMYGGNTVNNCYFNGMVSVTAEDGAIEGMEKLSVYCGGMAGDAGEVKVTNSYFRHSTEELLDFSGKKSYVGAVAGWTYAYSSNNVYYAPVYDYEVAYEHKYEAPWYRDRQPTDFETLAPELNEGQEAVVWEHCKEGDPPTLLWWRQMNEELFGDIGDI